MNASRWIASVLIVLLISGCGLNRQLQPVSVLAPELVFASEVAWPEVDWGIQVRRPVTDRMRDSERLFVRVGGSRLQAYPGAVWLDQAPDLVQAISVQALEDSGKFQAVGRAGGLRTRFALDTEIRRFEAVDTGGSNLDVELVARVRLLNQRTGRSVAARTFEIYQRSSGTQLDPLVDAFERALMEYFGELVPWLLEQGQEAVEADRGRDQGRDRDTERLRRPGS